jgi:hypothetical protein
MLTKTYRKGPLDAVPIGTAVDLPCNIRWIYETGEVPLFFPRPPGNGKPPQGCRARDRASLCAGSEARQLGAAAILQPFTGIVDVKEKS